MRQFSLSRNGAAIIAALILSLVVGGTKPAHAIAAFADRLGVPCSTCHEPVYPRLNRTGWQFRQLGYRTPAEMNTDLTPGKTVYGVPVSMKVQSEYESLQQTGYKQFSDYYVKSVSIYVAGPAGKNFGYWGEAQFPQQALTKVKIGSSAVNNGYVLEGPSTIAEGATLSPWLRYYKGVPGNYVYARLGNVSVDGFQGNNSNVIAATSPTTLTTAVNNSFTSGRGIELGYTKGNDAVAAYVIEPSGDGYVGNQPEEILQYLHFIGKHDSSVQLLYVNGVAPLNTYTASTTNWNNYSQIQFYANYRTLLKKSGSAINFLGGYAYDMNHNTVLATKTSPISQGKSIDASGYFGEVDYEISRTFVPYVRYDSFETGNYISGGSSKNANSNSYILGSAINVDKYAKLDIDFNHTASNASGTQDYVITQLFFMF